jgi:hypothetical protein
MALARDSVVVLGLVKAVLVVCTQVQEVKAEVVVVATMVALGMVADLAQVQALASILKAHLMATVGILTPVVMEVVVAEDKLEVTTDLAAKVVAAELALALAKLVHTGTDRVMHMLMPMATVMEKEQVRMVAVAAVKVVDLATVMQTLRSSTFEKMEPNLYMVFANVVVLELAFFYLYRYVCARLYRINKGLHHVK